MAVLTLEKCGELAKAKGVTVATIRRCIREHGEDAAKVRTKVTANEVGRLGRLT